jgi:hypothetical protein
MCTNARRRGATHENRHANRNTINRRSATGIVGCPEIRGLKPTNINRRSATRPPGGGHPPSRGLKPTANINRRSATRSPGGGHPPSRGLKPTANLDCRSATRPPGGGHPPSRGLKPTANLDCRSATWDGLVSPRHIFHRRRCHVSSRTRGIPLGRFDGDGGRAGLEYIQSHTARWIG